MAEQEQESSAAWTAPEERFLLTQMQTRLENIPFGTVLNELATTAQDNDLDLDPDIIQDEETGSTHTTATKTYWLFTVLHHWSIEPGEGYYEITESVYIRRIWLLPLIIVSTGLALGLTGLIPTLLPFQFRTAAINTASYMTIIGFLLVLLPTMTVKPVLPETSYADTVDDSILGTTILTVANAIVFGIGAAGFLIDIYWISALAVSVHVLLAFINWFYIDEINSSAVLFDVKKLLPTPSAEYVLLSFGALLPVGAIVATPVLGNSQSFGMLFMAIPAAILYTGAILYFVSNQDRLSLKLFRHSEKRYESRSWVRLSFLALSICFSYIGIAAAVWLVQQALAGSFNDLSLLTAALVLLPFTYFWLGILIQPATLLLQLRNITQNTRPAEFPEAETVDPEVQVSRNRIGPLAYSTGLKTRIVVPEQAVETLDSGEIKAVLAHEEAHAKTYSDSFLSFISPLAGVVLLTGQNVIYSFLNFREREFRADRYAAEQAGAENLVSALRTVEAASLNLDLDSGEPGSFFTSFTPFVPTQEQVSGWITQWFSTFFGGFALSKAHPSTEERIDQLQGD